MKKDNYSKTLIILMILCVCLSIATLGIVVYDRFIKKEPEHALLKPVEGVPTVQDVEENDTPVEENEVVENQ